MYDDSYWPKGDHGRLMLRIMSVAALCIFLPLEGQGEELTDIDMQEIVALANVNWKGDVISIEEVEHRDEDGQLVPYRNVLVVFQTEEGSHRSFRASKMDGVWRFDPQEYFRLLDSEGIRAKFEKDLEELDQSAQSLIGQFYELYNAGDFDAINEHVDIQLPRNIDLRKVKAKYGLYIGQESRRMGCSRGHDGTVGKFLTFHSTYEYAKLIERFYFRRDESGATSMTDYKYMVSPNPDMPENEPSPDETLAFINRSRC